MNKISCIFWAFVATFTLLFTGVSTAQPHFVPADWSPNSRYLATLETEGNESRVFPANWIFGNTSLNETTLPANRWSIWIYDRESARSFRAVQTDGYLSSPCWSAVGDALVFVRFTPSTSQDLRSLWIEGAVELVCQHATGERKVFHRESGRFPAPIVEALAGQSPDCSADGRWIAAPWAGSRTVLLYDAKENAVVDSWTFGSMPRFSPNADHVALLMPGPIPRYAIYALNDRATLLQEIPTQTQHPARWEKTGSLLSAIQEEEPKGQAFPDFGAGRRQKQFQWMLYRAGVSRPRELLTALTRGSEREDSYSMAEIDLADRKGEIVINVSSVGSGSSLEFVQLMGNTSSVRWHPLDTRRADSPLLLGVPRYSPDETMLSFRFGLPNFTAPLGIADLKTRSVRIVAHTLESKLKALWGITFALDRVVRNVSLGTPGLLEWTEPATTESLGEDFDHPLVLFDLPAPWSRREAERQEAVEKLSREGLDLLAEIRQGHPGRNVRNALDHVELFFLYAREDYNSAGRLARTVSQAMPIDADEISRWCVGIVVVQCHLGAGDRDLARTALESLTSHPPIGATVRDEAEPERDIPIQFRKRIDERLELLMNELATDKQDE